MLRILLLILVCILASAQDAFTRKADQIKALASRPPAEWNDALVLKVMQMYLDLYLDMLWAPELHHSAAPRLPQRRPNIVVQIAGELRTPIWSGGTMTVPLEYLNYLNSIGLLVGHDIFVDDQQIDLPNPLLSAPFRSSHPPATPSAWSPL